MPEKNVNQRLLIIGAAILIGLVFLWPPQQKLRPGLDIAGGTSLIFEVDTEGIPNDQLVGLAERIKEHLQRRVDPKGVYNLTWRVHGRNRIEVQMPLPPKDAQERRDAYAAALEQLFSREYRRGELEEAFRAPGEQRDVALEKLARRDVDHALTVIQEFDALTAGDASDDAALAEFEDKFGAGVFEHLNRIGADGRTALRADIEAKAATRLRYLQEAAARYDEWLAARAALEAGPPATQPSTAPAEQITEESLRLAYRDATELYEDAVYRVLTTNLNRRRFEETVKLDRQSDVRKRSIEHLYEEHAQLFDRIANVLTRYQTFRSGKRYLDSPADLKRLLRGSGRLEFRILAEPSPENRTKYDRYRRQLTDGQLRRPGDPEGWFRIENPVQFFGLESQAQLETFDYRNSSTFVVEQLGDQFYVLAKTTPEAGLLQGVPGQQPWRLTRAYADRDEHGKRAVRFNFDAVGGRDFYRLTSSHLKQQLCLLVDDVAYSSATIQSAIRTSGQITGDFSQEKVTYLVRTMEGGMLPGRLKDTPLSERTVGSSLGEANRDAAVQAGLIGAIAVIVIMITYYWACGAIAVVALSMNVLLVLAALALLNARVTLDGIAGIILAIGMAVDANVLIYERMREEKDRGSSLRMIVKNGYDKALSTIFDSNITTLLTCIIIYYVGSEEVKGFGLTLGWGIVLNLFTAIFVTRTLFAVLLKYNIVKSLGMLRLIGVPSINWYAKRKYFLPTSLVILIIGLGLLFQRGADVFDVEFRGGVAAEVELTEAGLNDKDIAAQLQDVAAGLRETAPALEDATVASVPGELNAYQVTAEGIGAEMLAAMISEPLEREFLVRDGVRLMPDQNAVKLYVKEEKSAEDVTMAVHNLATQLVSDAQNLDRASVNAVLDTAGAEAGLVWNVTTTVTNMELVEYALTEALGEKMRIQPRVAYSFQGRNGRPYPVTERLLDTVVPNLPAGKNADVTDYLGGAALHFQQLDPPQSVELITARLENMHFQPDFQDVPRRDFTVIGIEEVPGRTDEKGNPVYSSMVIVTVDPDISYIDDPDAWWTDFAQQELNLVTSALSNEQTLRKVMQFKPQIADRSVQQASVALLLSWGMIIGYVWLRFGRPVYGVAGVAALVHDVLIALAFVGISGWIGGQDHPLGNAILINDFKIDMTIVAALLTIIGYSINDTIVVFDRIRETRGRLGIVTPQIINDSINQTLSRTLMTSITTLAILLIMYIFGGSSIRGFNYCMIIGILTGSYSSIAVASPLLMVKFLGGGAGTSKQSD